jgi:Skp family chaperone for outer membrane proteins
MRRRLFAVSFFAALAICSVSSSLFPQEPDRPPLAAPSRTGAPKSPVALLDLKYVFDHYHAFQERKREIDASVQLAEATLKLRKASVEKLKADLARLGAKSPRRAELEDTVAREDAELRIAMANDAKALMRKEAELYSAAHRDILDVVNEHMEEQGFLVVVRFNSASSEDDDDVRGIAKQLNNPVVAFRKGVDITADVLRRLNQRSELRTTLRTVPQR